MHRMFGKVRVSLENPRIIRVLKVVVAVCPALFILFYELFRRSILQETRPTFTDGLFFVAVAIFAVFLYKIVSSLIKRTQEENLRRNRELSVLNEIAMAVNESLDLGVLLPHVMERLVQVTKADSGQVFLIDEKSSELSYELRVRMPTEASKLDSSLLNNNDGLVREVARSNEPIIIQDTQDSENVVTGFRSLAVVPLKSRSGILGVLVLLGLEPDHFKSNEASFLANIGSQIAVGIENARLYERVQGLVITEERERIAKELHDGLAQVLGYVITKSEATRQILSKMAVATDYLAELENVARDVYTDTREDILGLRTAVSGDRDLVSALREYLSRFSQMHNIRTSLEVGDQAVPHMSPQVELQAIRIVQEALSNIRKHAQASCALVKVAISENEVTLVVEDDGKGFDVDELEQSDSSKFGIRTIKERAQSIHSRLDIESDPGHGTKVTLSIPLNLP
jgi:signal transduction histidine kinase